MTRKFTKQPSKVYATKAYTKGYVTSEPILVSANGNFKLIIECGIGRADTPYANFEIKQSAKANNAVIDIDINYSWGSYEDGMPIINLPRKTRNEYAYVNYGFSSERKGNAWIRDTFVPIITEGLDFCDTVNNFFESTSSQELLEMCKDVFLDMGIDYDSYIQQEADSYL